MKKPRRITFSIDLVDLIFETTQREAIAKFLEELGQWARRKAKWEVKLEAFGNCPSFNSGALQQDVVTLAKDPARISDLLPYIIEQIKTRIELEEVHSMPLTFSTVR